MDVKYKIGMFGIGSTLVGAGQSLLNSSQYELKILGVILLLVGGSLAGGAVYLMFKQEAMKIADFLKKVHEA